MRIVSWLLTVVMTTSIALAQQSVPPPPQPAPGKPDAQSQPADNGPSLEATMKYIQDKVNEQGNILTISSMQNVISGSSSTWQHFITSRIVSVDPAGGLSIEQSFKDVGDTESATGTFQVYFKDFKNLQVLNSIDYKHLKAPSIVYQDDPPYFELLVHFVAGKTVQQHTHRVASGKHGKITESDDTIGEFVLHFRDEETADRVAKAFVHAIELCGGGSKPELF